MGSADYVALTNDLLFHMVFTRNAEALRGLLSVLLTFQSQILTRLKCSILCSIQI